MEHDNQRLRSGLVPVVAPSRSRRMREDQTKQMQSDAEPGNFVKLYSHRRASRFKAACRIDDPVGQSRFAVVKKQGHGVGRGERG